LLRYLSLKFFNKKTFNL